MENKKKINPIFYIIGAVILVAIIGTLIYFANQSGTDDSSSTPSTSQSSKAADYPTNFTKHAAVANATSDLSKVALPQLSSTVAADEAEVELETTAGNIKIKLFPKLAPNAVQNFLVLAKHGYYKNNEFFRIINNFMIQTGDPGNTGTGSASIFGGQAFDTEISNSLYNIRGALALANTGQPSSSSSQFFIVQNKQDMSKGLTTDKYPQKIIDAYKHGGYPSLDGSYTVFGQVISGMDVVDKIAGGKVQASSSGEQSSPVNPEKITGVKILKNWDFN